MRERESEREREREREKGIGWPTSSSVGPALLPPSFLLVWIHWYRYAGVYRYSTDFCTV